MSDSKHRFFIARIMKAILVWTILVPAACFAVVVSVFAILLWRDGFFADARAARAESRMYTDLEIGMNLAEVEHLFNRSPNYTCQFKDFTVHYFFQPRFDDDEYTRRSDRPERVESLDDVPSIYGAKQILIDSNGRIVAYTWNGEELVIHTIQGKFSGAAINELPDDFFDSLGE